MKRQFKFLDWGRNKKECRNTVQDVQHTWVSFLSSFAFHPWGFYNIIQHVQYCPLSGFTVRVAELVSGVCQPNHHITVHCPNDNTKFRNIIRNAEGIRNTTWHILYSISFPRFISCYISRNFGLSLGQCTSIVGAQLFFYFLCVSVKALLGAQLFFGLSLGQCTSIVGHNCFLDCLWDSVQALLGHNCFFGLSLGQCTSIVGSQLLNHRAGWCWCDGLRFLLGCVCDIY